MKSMKLLEVEKESIKKVHFYTSRRKWQNDFLSLDYDGFRFHPIFENNYDGEVNLLRTKLSFNYLRKNKYFIYIISSLRFIEKTFFTGFSLKSFRFYDGAISTSFIRNTKTNYLIYVENPSSIINYNYNVSTSILNCLFKKNFVYNSEKENFKGFVFFSHFSKETFYKYYNNLIPYDYKCLGVVYPFTFNNPLITEQRLIFRSKEEKINLLYISSLFSLKGGCEIIEAFLILAKKYNVYLSIVTETKTIPDKYYEIILKSNRINLLENKLNNSELQSLYSVSHILLHPTLMDSTAIVVMEALKSGMPVISTDTFAVNEYIIHGLNGFLIENPIKAFNSNFNLNRPIKFFGNKNIAHFIDEYKRTNIFHFMIKDILYYSELIIQDYQNFSLNAFRLATESEFEEEKTKSHWSNIIKNHLF